MPRVLVFPSGTLPPNPMHSRAKTRFAPLALTVVLVGLMTASSIAAVTVYKNDFSSREDVKEVKKSGGKNCKRKLKSKKGKGKKKGKSAMSAIVEQGPAECLFRLPVQGDAPLPDHDLKANGKVSKSVAKSVRKSAFLVVEARSGGDGVGYALRVFPHTGRFELTRGPGGAEFPVRGTDEAIQGVGKRNSLRLVVDGTQVRALVNGREVAQVSDPDPGEVNGTKVRFGLGNERGTGKDVSGTFSKVTVGVPEP